MMSQKPARLEDDLPARRQGINLRLGKVARSQSLQGVIKPRLTFLPHSMLSSPLRSQRIIVALPSPEDIDALGRAGKELAGAQRLCDQIFESEAWKFADRQLVCTHT